MPGTPLSHLRPPQEEGDNNNDDRAERGFIQAENQRALIEADLNNTGYATQDATHTERSPLLSSGGQGSRVGTYSSLNSL